jgi:hypothetical protein
MVLPQVSFFFPVKENRIKKTHHKQLRAASEQLLWGSLLFWNKNSLIPVNFSNNQNIMSYVPYTKSMKQA